MNRIRRYMAVLGVVAAPFIASTAVADIGATQTRTSRTTQVQTTVAPHWLDRAAALPDLTVLQRTEIARMQAYVRPAHQVTVAAKKALLDRLASYAVSGYVDPSWLDASKKAVIAAED